MSDAADRDEELERRCAHLFPSRTAHRARTFRGMHSTDAVRMAAELVDGSSVVERLAAWRHEDNPHHGTRGGRPAVFSDRHVLILHMVHAITGEPLLITALTDTVHSRLNHASREILRLPESIEFDSHRRVYTNLRRAIRRMVDVIDSAPYSTGRRLLPNEIKERHALRTTVAAVLAEKLRRTSWVTNQLLHSTYLMLPSDIRSEWKGTVCVDGTAIPVWGAQGTPRSTRSGINPTHSPEFDAGWHVRQADDHADNPRFSRTRDTFVWAYEATIAVMAKDDATTNFPPLALALSVEKPAGRVAENAMVCVEEIAARGLPANYFVGDRAYLPSSSAEKLQGPLKALGYRLIADLKKTQLGIQDQHAGAIQVEGTWYCPAMPKALVQASIEHTHGGISDEVYRAQIDARRNYQLQQKTKADHNGVVQMRCPAAGPSATVDCPLKPRKTSLGIPKLRTQIFEPPDHPDRICTNKESTAFGPETGLKHGQAVPYRSKEWHQLYHTPRNTIEGFNGIVKDDGHSALASSGRRRARGYTIQWLYTAFLLSGTNIRLIDSFLAKRHRTVAHKATIRPDRRKRAKTLASYRQNPNAPPLVGPAADANR
ncbi:hypothetical protein [Mycobacteroides abscessus]|uniref:hypothetical protein n=1 Tax=Mycobacteroides abscessus TaxID=36809 RepID=UPI000929F0B6|nr:hypothetical protein [Mycobacteroides abscessus]SIE70627.1 Uncharacterised protein [Mycobacteroides abscessus subsp. abscessus]